MNITTTDLSDFNEANLKDLEKLLKAHREQGLPEDFNKHGVHVMMNKHSGNVFLTNSEFQVAMLNGNDLESWYYCFNCGHEGFAEDCQLNDEGCNECNKEGAND